MMSPEGDKYNNLQNRSERLRKWLAPSFALIAAIGAPATYAAVHFEHSQPHTAYEFLGVAAVSALPFIAIGNLYARDVNEKNDIEAQYLDEA